MSWHILLTSLSPWKGGNLHYFGKEGKNEGGKVMEKLLIDKRKKEQDSQKWKIFHFWFRGKEEDTYFFNLSVKHFPQGRKIQRTKAHPENPCVRGHCVDLNKNALIYPGLFILMKMIALLP